MIACLNCSSDVNVVYEGSPSRIFKVLRISLGITIHPKSSTLLTIPVAVPDIFVGFQKPSSSVDRCHSLCSLFLPQAALARSPVAFIYLSPFPVGNDLCVVPVSICNAERHAGRSLQSFYKLRCESVNTRRFIL